MSRRDDRPAAAAATRPAGASAAAPLAPVASAVASAQRATGPHSCRPATVGRFDSAGRVLPQIAILLLLGLVAYSSSLAGGWLWDDDVYVQSNANLSSVDGLVRIWLKPVFGAADIPQWYPMVYTTFWVEHQFFNDAATGYRVDNLLLHLASALVLWRLLTGLKVPGAYAAALLFAVHPVMVESVAWVTERKNTLSTLFYLLAAWNYLAAAGLLAGRGDPAFATRRRSYAWATTLFVLALLSKTVTATFPAAMLLVTWWKRGRLGWRDVAATVPLFVIGVGLGLYTAHTEHTAVGANGPEWVYGPTVLTDALARVCIAGRAVCFYAGKIIWPLDLTFIYERWTIDIHTWQAWFYPAAVGVVLTILLLLRHRIGRGPATAGLFFVGTLVPALGFANVFPHRYSFVADHFQYLAAIGLIVLIAATAGRAVEALSVGPLPGDSLPGDSLPGDSLAGDALPSDALAKRNRRFVGGCVLAVVSLVLTALTWLHGLNFQSSETLWRDAMAKSPGNWMGYMSYGNLLVDREQPAEAVQYYLKAYELRPGIWDTRLRAGQAALQLRQPAEGERLLRSALPLAPGPFQRALTLYNLAMVDLKIHRDTPGAIDKLQQALELSPDYADAQRLLTRIAGPAQMQGVGH